MSIPCPYCKAVLNPKGLKPGRFQPKCPKCAKAFVIIVPEDEGGTVMVQKIAEKPAEKPADGSGPDTSRTPKTERVPKPAPVADTAKNPIPRPTTKSAPKAEAPKTAPKLVAKRKLSDEDRAALILEGKDPADYEDA